MAKGREALDLSWLTGYNGSWTHYRVLGLSPTATQAEIKKRYHYLVTKLHTDAKHTESSSTHALSGIGLGLLYQRVVRAYEDLQSEKKRKAYDLLLEYYPQDTGLTLSELIAKVCLDGHILEIIKNQSIPVAIREAIADAFMTELPKENPLRAWNWFMALSHPSCPDSVSTRALQAIGPAFHSAVADARFKDGIQARFEETDHYGQVINSARDAIPDNFYPLDSRARLSEALIEHLIVERQWDQIDHLHTHADTPEIVKTHITQKLPAILSTRLSTEDDPSLSLNSQFVGLMRTREEDGRHDLAKPVIDRYTAEGLWGHLLEFVRNQPSLPHGLAVHVTRKLPEAIAAHLDRVNGSEFFLEYTNLLEYVGPSHSDNVRIAVGRSVVKWAKDHGEPEVIERLIELDTPPQVKDFASDNLVVTMAKKLELKARDIGTSAGLRNLHEKFVKLAAPDPRFDLCLDSVLTAYTEARMWRLVLDIYLNESVTGSRKSRVHSEYLEPVLTDRAEIAVSGGKIADALGFCVNLDIHEDARIIFGLAAVRKLEEKGDWRTLYAWTKSQDRPLSEPIAAAARNSLEGAVLKSQQTNGYSTEKMLEALDLLTSVDSISTELRDGLSLFVVHCCAALNNTGMLEAIGNGTVPGMSDLSVHAAKQALNALNPDPEGRAGKVSRDMAKKSGAAGSGSRPGKQQT